MHLTDDEYRRFFANLQYNLCASGAIYISVKSGIETGPDNSGRYMRNFTEEELRKLICTVSGLEVKELWYTDDTLSRRDFRWLNVIAVKASML